MPQHVHAMEPEPAPAWTLTTDGAVFFGFNGQQREFTDFYTWESQNWFMLDAARPVGNGRLTLDGMISLEPFTMKKLGSPQVFQTGETYRGGPLIDYQHPHDLVMELGGRYRFVRGPMGYTMAADLVGVFGEELRGMLGGDAVFVVIEGTFKNRR